LGKTTVGHAGNDAKDGFHPKFVSEEIPSRTSGITGKRLMV
tara:strand:- start:368 stop:490 length:123 start_codon:yes stop_codon:yes gene_type:complete